ncbi:GDP-mannose 4,6-dehydratase [Tetrabaena socialis]|uniref:GDP-mannose 4,6-dehydratase n=1 Tax=Tetrabaena socialis TaxID=47790 RepID=A0A2J7ZK89_9CHLO|nr:GDP-mannose 4,6-dehydratase [Tetrabaena socialis]|eukprot:PNH00679.1 GDP-mannose 4,6-dehydratase [Tetrabaena socialis]
MHVGVAFITGVSGQDGSYLAELLIEKGYIVHGMVRRSSNMVNLDRLVHLHGHPHMHTHYGDVTDLPSIMRIMRRAADDLGTNQILEVYNLAAQSHVKVSFDVPIYTAATDALGTLNVLEAIVQLDIIARVRVYQASTSELFGSTPPPQNEASSMCPQSPYAVSKLFAHWSIKNYRDVYGIYAVSGILFNHESERRAENFVTRKISKFVAGLYHGRQTGPLHLGNLNALRDWGHAKDYVLAMWMMLQQGDADDYVISTGEQHSVREFVETALAVIGKRIQWRGTGLDEKGYLVDEGGHGGDGWHIVEVDPSYFRPTEVETLLGDSSKAREKLGWMHATSFESLVRLMVHQDIEQCKKE